VSKEATGLEVALVFDNTGSMASQSRLSTLKVAANDFVEILFGPRDEADTLKVAVVPFSQFVNVGPDKSNRLWVDTNGGADRYSNDNFDSTNSGYHNWAAWQAIAQAAELYWPGCVESRPGALSVNDTTPNPNIPNTLFVPAFAPDEPPERQCSTCYSGQHCGNANVYYNNYISRQESRRGWRREQCRLAQ
jgi:hypothetical protein